MHIRSDSCTNDNNKFDLLITSNIFHSWHSRWYKYILWSNSINSSDLSLKIFKTNTFRSISHSHKINLPHIYTHRDYLYIPIKIEKTSQIISRWLSFIKIYPVYISGVYRVIRFNYIVFLSNLFNPLPSLSPSPKKKPPKKLPLITL